MDWAEQDSEVMPLQVAATRGLEDHMALYLEHWATWACGPARAGRP